MQWEWIVPIIAVVLWILSNVIRSPEEQPPDLRRRRLPGAPEGEAEPAAEPKPQQQPNEVERFLEEINRMRRRAAAEEPRSQESPRAEPPPRPRTPDVPRRPQPQQQQQRAQRPRPVPPSRPRVEPVRPVLTIPPPPPPPPPPPLPVVPVLSMEVLDVLPASAPMPIAVKSAMSGTEAPTAAVLRGMFSNPQTLAAAIVLHEVIGPPLSKRRRR